MIPEVTAGIFNLNIIPEGYCTVRDVLLGRLKSEGA